MAATPEMTLKKDPLSTNKVGFLVKSKGPISIGNSHFVLIKNKMPSNKPNISRNLPNPKSDCDVNGLEKLSCFAMDIFPKRMSRKIKIISRVPKIESESLLMRLFNFESFL